MVALRNNRRRASNLERRHSRRDKRKAAYGIAGKRKRKGDRKKKLKKTLLKVGVAIFIIGVIGIGSLFAYYTKDLPDHNGIKNRAVAESTKIYARDGETILFEIFDEERRTSIDFEEIPETIKNATVAIEDDDFYSHHGVDFMGILRAVFTNIISGETKQGGSTITQQLVKNAILTPERTYSRKIKELILAIQIESRFTKDEILNLYLNEISYGSNAYGIQSASKTFFDKDAKDLSLAESALLAALPQRPSSLSPYGPNLEELLTRKDFVLERMNKNGMITEEEAKDASEVDLVFAEPDIEIKAPHFVFWVKEELTEKYGDDLVERGGLKVTTTLDMDMQKAAEQAIKDGSERNLAQYGVTNAAMTAIDPRNGQVMAHVGSRDYFNDDIDGSVDVTRTPQQPGSSFKPIEYATAFSEGYTPNTILFDVKTDFDGYKPDNYDKSQSGPMTMRSALQNSKNIPAVKTTYLAGKDDVIDMARALGISDLENKEDYGLAVGLGAGEIQLVDHVRVFGTLANEGNKQPQTKILNVKDATGKVLEEWSENDGVQVLDKNIALTMSNVLSDDGARSGTFGSGSALTLPDRRAGAKTGTTEDNTDGLTMGYVPQLAAGVWVGNNDNKQFPGGDGFFVAAPIWHQFMLEATKDLEPEWYADPEPLPAPKPVLSGKAGGKGEKVKISKIDGKLAPDNLPGNYIEEKEFRSYHSILHYVNKDNPLGPVPGNPSDDSMYKTWESAVKGWSKGKDDGAPPTKTSPYGAAEVKPKVSVLQPSSGGIVTSTPMTIVVSASALAGVRSVDINLGGNTVASLSTQPYAVTFDPGVSNGFHTIKAVVTDKYGGTAETSIDIQIQIDTTPPVASFTKAGLGSDIDVDASGSTDNIGIVSYVWDFGDSSSGSGEVTSHTYASSGTFTISLTVTDEAGNSDIMTDDVVIP